MFVQKSSFGEARSGREEGHRDYVNSVSSINFADLGSAREVPESFEARVDSLPARIALFLRGKSGRAAEKNIFRKKEDKIARHSWRVRKLVSSIYYSDTILIAV